MAWTESRFIFKPTGELPWSRTHAQVPSALVLADRIRIYYATRDGKGRSMTSFIDVARDNPSNILYVHDQPVMPLGKPGTHDEDGVMVGCVIAAGSEMRLYYTGWSKGVTVPYRVSVGLAISRDNGITFERAFEGPVVDRTPSEAYMTMSPCVIAGAQGWRMWYGSGTGWVEQDGKMEPLYIVKYAESKDGIHWVQNNVTCIEPLDALEANTRPSVLQGKDGFDMWFSYRGSVDYRDGKGAYRIGHATSSDGLHWQRHADPAGLAPGSSEWNNRMMAYPSVVECDGRRFMFHNGNSFGQSGFGWCEWKE